MFSHPRSYVLVIEDEPSSDSSDADLDEKLLEALADVSSDSEDNDNSSDVDVVSKKGT